MGRRVVNWFTNGDSLLAWCFGVLGWVKQTWRVTGLRSGIGGCKRGIKRPYRVYIALYERYQCVVAPFAKDSIATR